MSSSCSGSVWFRLGWKLRRLKCCKANLSAIRQSIGLRQRFLKRPESSPSCQSSELPTWEVSCVIRGEDNSIAEKIKSAVDQKRDVDVPELDEIWFEGWLRMGNHV